MTANVCFIVPAFFFPRPSAAIDHLTSDLWPWTSMSQHKHVLSSLWLEQHSAPPLQASLGKNQPDDPLVPSHFTHWPIRWSGFGAKHLIYLQNEGLHQSHTHAELRQLVRSRTVETRWPTGDTETCRLIGGWVHCQTFSPHQIIGPLLSDKKRHFPHVCAT